MAASKRIPSARLAAIAAERKHPVPCVCGESTRLRQKFVVRPDATKKDVKAAVELLWKEKKVEVAGVQIVNVRGKAKRFGAYAGRRRNWKKAYVSLKPGTEINFAQEA